MDEEVVQQMGLLLTQVRVARMSLEHIERSTSRFAGLAVSAAVATPDRPAFGAPPMIDGALKVYVVNIGDLVAAAPGGGFLETLLGGVGRFVGGLVGGLVGGVIGGAFSAGQIVDRLAALVESVERITNKLLTTLGLTSEEWRILLGLKPDASGREPPKPAEPASPMSQAIADLLGRMAPAQVVTVVELLTRMVDGLILLIPMAVGAVAALISTAGDLRLEIVEWIGFALRQLLLLRAVAVAVLADTLSLVLPIAATIVSAVARMADVVLSGLGAILGRAVTAAFTSARILAGGLASAVNAAVSFLTGTVLPLLNYFQQTAVFRLVAWFTTALPAMLTALAAAAGRPMGASDTSALQSLSKQGVDLLKAPVPAAPKTTTLSATDILAALGTTEQAELRKEIEGLGSETRRVTKESLEAAGAVFTDTATSLREAALKSTTTFGGVLEEQLGAARGHIDAVGKVMGEAEDVARRRPETTLDKIADSYRTWLTGGGMQLLLGEITRHFASTPAEGEAGARSVPGRVLQGFVDAEGRHDVIVEVGEVVIELGAPGQAGAQTPVSQTTVEPGAAALLAVRNVVARGGEPADALPVAVA